MGKLEELNQFKFAIAYFYSIQFFRLSHKNDFKVFKRVLTRYENLSMRLPVVTSGHTQGACPYPFFQQFAQFQSDALQPQSRSHPRK